MPPPDSSASPSAPHHNKGLRPAGVAGLVAFVVGLALAVAGAGGLAVSLEGAVSTAVIGGLLWWYGPERPWNEIGQALVVAVALGIILGVPQYLLDRGQAKRESQRADAQKLRDFQLSLTLQNDLRGAALAHKDLSGVRLRGKDLRGADLRWVDLRHAHLDHTNLGGANLAHAHLDHADLRRASLRGAWLDHTSMVGANLEGAVLAGAGLPHADLRGANLEITNMKAACLSGADLRRARVAGADMAFGVLTRARLQGAQFETDLKPARLGYAGLATTRVDSHTTWPLDFGRERRSAAIAGIPARTNPARIPPRRLIPATVIAVTDGDTARVEVSSKDARRLRGPGRTRLIGVDAPDLSLAGGSEAKAVLARRLLGKRVFLQLGAVGMDRRSRYLVYVRRRRSSTKTFNEELLETGRVTLKMQPGEAGADALQAAELKAKQRGAGLWRQCPKPVFGT